MPGSKQKSLHPTQTSTPRPRSKGYEEHLAKAYNECFPWDDYYTDNDDERTRPLTREEMLVELRGFRERSHRNQLFQRNVRWPFEPYFPLLHPAPALPNWQAEECCNKTVAVYSLVGNDIMLLLRLKNYLYRAWLKPYRNNIEFGSFIAKLIVPRPQYKDPDRGIDHDPCLEPGQSLEKIKYTVRLVGELHQHIAAEAVTVLTEAENSPDRQLAFPDEKSDFKYLSIRPLFCALTMIVAEYDEDAHKEDFGQQAVYLLRTGYTQGLSAPISFETLHMTGQLFDQPKYEGHDTTLIQTTLKAATKFILDLETREQEVFGIPPEPETVVFSSYWESKRLENLGWTGSNVFGRPSSWVDTSLFPKWLGSGAYCDKRCKLKEDYWDIDELSLGL